jgi:hypothetical protein
MIPNTDWKVTTAKTKIKNEQKENIQFNQNSLRQQEMAHS